MANGELIAEIRDLSKSGKKIPAATRDRLILAAIADLYTKVDRMYLLYQFLAGAGGVLSAVAIALITMWVTGQLKIVTP